MEVMNLNKLEANHPVNYSVEFPKRNLNELERYANVDDVRLKRAPSDTLEGMANALILAAERAEQAKIRANPPRNCKGYVERSDYPITSLYSDFKDLIEAGEKDWDDYRVERRKWKRCKHMYCLNYFPTDKTNFKRFEAKRKDSEYCDAWCRSAHRDAHRRFKKHGSYLPVYYYLAQQTESVGNRARKNEHASEAESIEKEITKQRPMMKRTSDEIDEAQAGAGEVVTYNINDLSDEEIKEKNLCKYIEKRLDKRGNIPVISEGGGGSDASFLGV